MGHHPSVKQALESYKSKKLVAIPTETVYGLAAPVNDIEKIKQIFALKERPIFDPLIVHVSNIEMAKHYINSWPSNAQILAEAFWPGPLSIVLPKNPNTIDDLITAGLPTVALRCPNNELTLKLIDSLDIGLAAPSANKFTKTSPTKAEHVSQSFSPEDVYVLKDLNKASSQVGIESTIVKIENNNVIILRLGIITRDDILKVLPNVQVTYGKTAVEKIEAPGQHHQHYRPDFPLYIGTKKLKDINIKGNGQLLKLGNDPILVARNLYSLLRTPLQENKDFAYIKLPKEAFKKNSLWQAILDRLNKAASKSVV